MGPEKSRARLAQPPGVWSQVVALRQDRWPCSCQAGAAPVPRATFRRLSYLPSEEPADPDDAQDIEHRRAHDGPNSHVTLGDEDA